MFTSLYKDLECGGSVLESYFKELYRYWADGNRKCRKFSFSIAANPAEILKR
jgi:hypothetical protein